MAKFNKALGDAAQTFAQTYLAVSEKQRQDKRDAEEARWREFYGKLAERNQAMAEDNAKRAQEQWSMQKPVMEAEGKAKMDELKREEEYLSAFQEQMGMSEAKFKAMDAKSQWEYARDNHIIAKHLSELQLANLKQQKEQSQTTFGWQKEDRQYETTVARPAQEKMAAAQLTQQEQANQLGKVNLDLAVNQANVEKNYAEVVGLDTQVKMQHMRQLIGLMKDLTEGAPRDPVTGEQMLPEGIKNVQQQIADSVAGVAKALGPETLAKMGITAKAQDEQGKPIDLGAPSAPADNGLKLTPAGEALQQKGQAAAQERRAADQAAASAEGRAAMQYNWTEMDERGNLVLRGSNNKADFDQAVKEGRAIHTVTKPENIDIRDYNQPLGQAAHADMNRF